MIATLRHIPKTHNATRGGHWSVRHTEARRWRRIISICCGEPRYGQVQGRQRIRITVHRGRLQDKDNRYASCKPILDALKRCGWCVDDSDEWVDYDVRERVEKDKRKRRTVIEMGPCQVEIEEV